MAFIKWLAGLSLGILLVGMYRTKQQHNRIAPVEILTVGIDATSTTHATMEQNTVIGFDAAVIREIAKRMGKKALIKHVPTHALFNELKQGNLSFIAGPLVPESSFIFCQPYHGDHLLSFCQEQQELRAKIDTILQEMNEDGTLQALEKK